jgi:hypothetical protein
LKRIQQAREKTIDFLAAGAEMFAVVATGVGSALVQWALPLDFSKHDFAARQRANVTKP